MSAGERRVESVPLVDDGPERRAVCAVCAVQCSAVLGGTSSSNAGTLAVGCWLWRVEVGTKTKCAVCSLAACRVERIVSYRVYVFRTVLAQGSVVCWPPTQTARSGQDKSQSKACTKSKVAVTTNLGMHCLDGDTVAQRLEKGTQEGEQRLALVELARSCAG